MVNNYEDLLLFFCCLNAANCLEHSYTPSFHNVIRYSARCFGSTRHDLCVAVGTVFNEVLVWAASGTSQDNRVMVAVTLKGHEVHTTCTRIT